MFILEKEENIVRVVRKHWFVMLSYGFSVVIMALAPALIYELISGGFISSLFSFYLGTQFNFNFLNIAENIRTWILFAYSFWLLILWTFFFVEWTDYYLDVLLITNKRVLNVEQKGFWNREVISFKYDVIQDITVETRGIIQTFFKFGLMQIQTAGEKRCIIIKHAQNPESARSEILKQQATHKIELS